jgi:ATP-dependent protease ClpP protease subunit
VYIIRFSGSIGEDLDARWLADALDNARGQAIQLLVNSPGGAVFTGMEMAEMLQAYPGFVSAKVVGLAASMASYILTACDEVTVTSNSTVMIHNASGGAYGSAVQHRKLVTILEKIDANLVKGYARKTGHSTEKIKDWMALESWFFGREVLDELKLATIYDDIDDDETDRESAILDGKNRFAAAYHAPTPSEIAAHAGEYVDLSSLNADDLTAARVFGIPVDEYAKLQKTLNPKALSSDEEDIQAAKLAGMTLENYRKYSGMMEARR